MYGRMIMPVDHFMMMDVWISYEIFYSSVMRKNIFKIPEGGRAK